MAKIRFDAGTALICAGPMRARLGGSLGTHACFRLRSFSATARFEMESFCETGGPPTSALIRQLGSNVCPAHPRRRRVASDPASLHAALHTPVPIHCLLFMCGLFRWLLLS